MLSSIDDIFKMIRYNIPLSKKECETIISFPNIWSSMKHEENNYFGVLEYAERRGNLSLMDYVLDNDIKEAVIQENKKNENILFSLIRKKNIDYFRYFVEYSIKYPEILINSKGNNVLQKISTEAWTHGYDIVKIKASESFSQFLKKIDDDGNNLAHYNAMGNKLDRDLLWYLKSDGLDINQLNKYKQNLLFFLDIDHNITSLMHQFTSYSFYDKLDKIISEFNLDINQQDINGDYPLLIFLLNKRPMLANTLLKKNANAFIKNIDNESAADIIYKKYRFNKKTMSEYPNFQKIINKYNFKNQISN